jgi:ribosomal protein S24E
MEILKQFRNSLFGRDEIALKVTSVSSPSKADLTKQLGEKLKKEENLIVVKEVQGNFGRREFSVKAFVYHSEDEKEQFEPKQKKKAGSSGGAKTPQEMLEGK